MKVYEKYLKNTFFLVCCILMWRRTAFYITDQNEFHILEYVVPGEIEMEEFDNA